MRKIICLLVVLIILVLDVQIFAQDETRHSTDDTTLSIKLINYIRRADRNDVPSVDHKKFEILKKPFKTPQDATAACLSCHTERHKEIMKNNHWTWSRDEELKGKGSVSLGKKNILNNFCIGISGSEGTCTRCHIGYGWSNKSFDFNNPNNIDCLVCHDNTGTYVKEKGKAGYPKESVDLNYVARNIGKPTKANCGVCHFWGGGGNNVKHGDLEKATLTSNTDVDVHMGYDGEDMECVDCHITEKHQIAGKLYALSSENKNRATCTYCHTSAPHKKELLNEHFIRVTCQACHIPEYAKVNGTKMWWDWSNAGRLDEDGKAIHENDADGNHNYLSIKGNFVYDDHVIPEYGWFNGTANHQLITDKIESVPVQMNILYGSYQDKSSKIWPMKVHRGKQIYDSVYNTLIQPKLWDSIYNDSAYWKGFDWGLAAEAGMKYLGLPYSGKYGFVETEMYWPLNHMVSKRDKALRCTDCHARSDSRLEQLTDFYLPGRDKSSVIDGVGKFLIVFALLGVIIHGILRAIYRRKCFFDKE